MSIEASSMFPGFRFSPTDVELISYYLKKKMEGSDKCVEVISEVEICRYEPWDLPDGDFWWIIFNQQNLSSNLIMNGFSSVLVGENTQMAHKVRGRLNLVTGKPLAKNVM